MAKKRRCSNCGRTGHNTRTCGNKAKKKKKTPAKKKTSRTMSDAEKVRRWGPVVKRFKSESSSAKHAVRRKGRSYSCQCKGWRFHRTCWHIDNVRARGLRKRKTRKRKTRKKTRRKSKRKARSRSRKARR